MTPEKQQELQSHLQAIAELLYEEADKDEITTLAGIEETVRTQTLKHITPELGFFSQKDDRHGSRKAQKDEKHFGRTTNNRETGDAIEGEKPSKN